MAQKASLEVVKDPVNDKTIMAEELLGLGFALIPLTWPVSGGCSCGRPDCTAQGKHPLIKSWTKDWSKDLKVVAGWLKKWPKANLGVVTGPPSGIVVLDIDKHSPGSDGMEALEEFENLYGSLPETWAVLTGGGGQHLYFRYPPGTQYIKGKVNIAPGLDIRGDGNQVVGPGSLHQSGKFYEWEITANPDLIEIAELPRWLIRLTRDDQGHETKPAWPEDGPISEGQRNNYITSRAGSLRRMNFSEEVMLAALLQENVKRCIPPLPENEVRQIVKSIGKKAPAPTTSHAHGEKVFACTDMGNAERLIKQYGADVAYCMNWKKWYTWTGSHFEEDTTGHIYELAKGTARAIPNEAQGIDDGAQYKQILAWAVKSQGRDKLKALVELAATDPTVAARPTDFDAEPWLLNTLSGIVDLKAGRLLPHDRQYMITKILPVKYDRDAACPRWLQFLDEVFEGNTDLTDFVQRAVGYSLTGDTSEQVLFLLYGNGANGKSIFINTLADLVGPYHRQAASTVFLSTKRDTVGEELAPLVGARLVTVVEVDRGRRLAESILKQATGGDVIRCRYLYSNSFEYKPQFKIWMAVNHRPKASGDDPAIWRRLRLIPFNARFSEENQDKRLVNKLRAELPGILAWAIEGCLKWQKEGLAAPEMINAATNNWRQENDTLGQFLEECCTTRNQYARCRVQDLYSAYGTWINELGEHGLTRRAFSQALRARGFSSVTSTGNRAYWQGLGLLVSENTS